MGGRNLKDTKFYTMPLDDLWKLHDEVISALASRIEAQKSELEKRLEQLGTNLGAHQGIFLRHGRTQKSPQNFGTRNHLRKLGRDAASNRTGFCYYLRKVDRWRTVASNEPVSRCGYQASFQSKGVRLAQTSDFSVRIIAGATSFTDLICGAPIERYDGQPVDNFNARRIASSPSTWRLLVSAAALEGMPTPSAFAYLRFAFRSRAWRMRPALRRRQCRLMMRGGTTVEGRCTASFGRSLVGIALATIAGPIEAIGRRSAHLDRIREERVAPLVQGSHEVRLGVDCSTFAPTDVTTATAEIVARAPIVERPCEVEASRDAFIHNHHIVGQPPSELGRHPRHCSNLAPRRFQLFSRRARQSRGGKFSAISR